MVNLTADQEINLAGNEMGLFIFNNRGLSEDEMALGTPDAKEAKDLVWHVTRCSHRYRLFSQRQSQQGADIVQIKYMILALMALIFFTSSEVRSFIEWISKVL